MGSQRLFKKSHLLVCFANKVYLPYCSVVFFVVCQLLRPIRSDFGELLFCAFPLLKERQGCTLISGVPAARSE